MVQGSRNYIMYWNKTIKPGKPKLQSLCTSLPGFWAGMIRESYVFDIPASGFVTDSAEAHPGIGLGPNSAGAGSAMVWPRACTGRGNRWSRFSTSWCCHSGKGGGLLGIGLTILQHSEHQKAQGRGSSSSQPGEGTQTLSPDWGSSMSALPV